MTVIYSLSIKTLLTFCAVGILVMTVEFDHIVKGLESMRFPKMITGMLGFAYRYIFLFQQEANRLMRAKKSRSFGRRKGWENWKLAAGIIPFFLSSLLERSHNIYVAMLSRGYRDTLPNTVTLKLNRWDYIFGVLFHLVLISAAATL